MGINISDYSQEELKSIVRGEQLSLLEKDENDDVFLELLNKENRRRVEEILRRKIFKLDYFDVLGIRTLNKYLKKNNYNTITHDTDSYERVKLMIQIVDLYEQNYFLMSEKVFNYLRRHNVREIMKEEGNLLPASKIEAWNTIKMFWKGTRYDILTKMLSHEKIISANPKRTKEWYLKLRKVHGEYYDVFMSCWGNEFEKSITSGPIN